MSRVYLGFSATALCVASGLAIAAGTSTTSTNSSTTSTNCANITPALLPGERTVAVHQHPKGSVFLRVNVPFTGLTTEGPVMVDLSLADTNDEPVYSDTKQARLNPVDGKPCVYTATTIHWVDSATGRTLLAAGALDAEVRVADSDDVSIGVDHRMEVR